MNPISTDYNKVWFSRTDGKSICIDCAFYGIYNKCALRKDKESITCGINCCDSYKFRGEIIC